MNFPELAERLFQLQKESIENGLRRADPDQRRWYIKRILSLENDAGKNFVEENLPDFAISSGLVRNKTKFESLLKSRRQEDLVSRAKRASESRSRPEIYYCPEKKKSYLWRGANDAYTSGGKEDALEELKRLGFSDIVFPGCHLKEANAFLSEIIRNPIDYAGGIAGSKSGKRTINGKAILVTSSPKLLGPEQRPYPTVMEFLRSRLDLGRQSDLGMQTNVFLDWLHLAVRDLYIDGGAYHPAQVLALIGERRAGKDVVAHDIVAPLLGGRIAKPMAHFTGETRFSDELVASENWQISDELDSVSPKTKAALEEALKQAAVSPALRLEGKFGVVVSVPTYRRLIVTCNDDRTSLEYFPGLRQNFADKIIMLDVQGVPFFGPGTLFTTFAEWKAAVSAELPGFLYYLLNEHVIAEERACPNYRVRSYHNPYLAGVLLELDPATALHEIILDSDIWGSGSSFQVNDEDGRRTVTTTAMGLMEHLGDQCPHAMTGLGVRAANHLGRLLTKLVSDRPGYYRRLPLQHGITRYAIVQPEGAYSQAQVERERVAMAGFS